MKSAGATHYSDAPANACPKSATFRLVGRGCWIKRPYLADLRQLTG
jgi:hypothetical protein